MGHRPYRRQSGKRLTSWFGTLLHNGSCSDVCPPGVVCTGSTSQWLTYQGGAQSCCCCVVHKGEREEREEILCVHDLIARDRLSYSALALGAKGYRLHSYPGGAHPCAWCAALTAGNATRYVFQLLRLLARTDLHQPAVNCRCRCDQLQPDTHHTKRLMVVARSKCCVRLVDVAIWLVNTHLVNPSCWQRPG